MSTARDLIWTWRAVRDEEPVTEEPADGRPVRSILAIWRRGDDGLWRAEGDPADAGLPFETLAVTVPLRELGPVHSSRSGNRSRTKSGHTVTPARLNPAAYQESALPGERRSSA